MTGSANARLNASVMSVCDARFCRSAILQEHYPAWRDARAELNELLLTAETWKE
jgi:hypothetical protein